MKWNWQQLDWPHFTYDQKHLVELEHQFIHNSGMLIGALKHIKADEEKELIVGLVSEEALKTSEIEGEFLNRESLQSSIRRHFGLACNKCHIPLAEQGISEMMIDLYRTFDSPLTKKGLSTWHEMLMRGRKDLTDRGRYRSHGDPMQVVSGPVHHPKIHFEAPPSKNVAGEMRKFVAWFNQTAPHRSGSLPALLRASIVHLYFVSIHPFEDGNGRLARALSEKSLSQNLNHPTLIALSYEIQKHRKDYYQALEKNNKENHISHWILYFSKTILNAQSYTQMRIEFLIDKTKFYDRFRNKLNVRQDKVIARMFREGPEGFQGGLSAENYIRMTKTSRATATRDLKNLVEIGVLKKRGSRKHTRYYLKNLGK